MLLKSKKFKVLNIAYVPGISFCFLVHCFLCLANDEKCTLSGYMYECSSLPTNFYQSEKYCENRGGTLARFLDEDAYYQLNKCCTGFKRAQYWIGLVTKTKCLLPKRPYTWVCDAECTSAFPLNISHDPSNRICQAVAITVQSPKTNILPDASELNCTDRNQFICQYPQASTASNIASITRLSSLPTTSSNPTDVLITSAISTETTSNLMEGDTTSSSVFATSGTNTSIAFTSSSANGVNFTAAVTNLPPAVTSAVLATISSLTTPIVSIKVALDSGLIAGIVVGGLAMIVVLACLYIYCFNRSLFKKLKGFPFSGKFASSTKYEEKEEKENPLYGSVTSPSEPYEVCFQSTNESFQTDGGKNNQCEINGSIDKNGPSSAYEMAEDVDSNEYDVISETPSVIPTPSNVNETDNCEGAYNKLYFPPQHGDTTLSP